MTALSSARSLSNASWKRPPFPALLVLPIVAASVAVAATGAVAAVVALWAPTGIKGATLAL